MLHKIVRDLSERSKTRFSTQNVWRGLTKLRPRPYQNHPQGHEKLDSYLSDTHSYLSFP